MAANVTTTNAGSSSRNAVSVTVLYTRTSRSKTFEIEKNTTLSQMFDEAYRLLGEQKQPSDTYFCKTGANLSNQLNRTVESVISSECKDAYFEIRGPSGGA